jgi:hypothetical protein
MVVFFFFLCVATHLCVANILHCFAKKLLNWSIKPKTVNFSCHTIFSKVLAEGDLLIVNVNVISFFLSLHYYSDNQLSLKNLCIANK